jgi:ribonucleoside-diphosphate reductase alpha chain
MNSPLGDLYVTINEDETAGPLRGLLHPREGGRRRDGRHRGDRAPRLAGAPLGIPITAVRDQLRGISCDRAVGVGPNKVLSAPDASRRRSSAT